MRPDSYDPRTEPALLSVVGASVRAAAGSARRAGFRVRAADLYGDVDLRSTADFEPLEGSYPEGFIEFLEKGPEVPWLYTGALENRPDLVRTCSALRPLWGNSAAVLERVRDPAVLQSELRSAGFAFPETRPAQEGTPEDQDAWLCKPRRSAAGHGIARTTHTANVNTSSFVYQRFTAGAVRSAVFVGDGNTRRDRHRGCRARLLGTTRQLTGIPWLNASEFVWCGNLAPARLSSQLLNDVKELGIVLVERFGLRGLFGVDFIETPNGELCVIEVNPRYPASTELIEYAQGIAALEEHAKMFEGKQSTAELPSDWGVTEVLGKGILYAPCALRMPEQLADRMVPQPTPGGGAVPGLADIPPVGREISAGEPLFTVFATGSSEKTCLANLRTRTEAYATLLNAHWDRGARLHFQMGAVKEEGEFRAQD